jgi:hypothetical protein
MVGTTKGTTAAPALPAACAAAAARTMFARAAAASMP